MAKYTREKIIEAFFELAINHPEKTSFTMVEIAEQAGISRQAIYQKHFKNFQEIIDYVHNLIDEQIYQIYDNYDMTSNVNPFDYVAENVLPTIYKNRKWINCLYTSAIDPSFEGFIVSTYTKWSMRNIHPKSEIFHLPDEVLIQLIVEQMTMSIKDWITQEKPTPPGLFKEDFLQLVKSPLYDYLTMEP